MVVLYVWSEVGGPSHMDLIPWYWKLGLALGSSIAIVRATAALVEEERAWNPKSLRWLLVILSFAISIAMVTYYCHLHEPAEAEPDTMEESTA
jgi:SNF family Na+-dependent transporter